METKQIFVVICCARHTTGEWVMARTERAFTTESAAKQYLSGKPAIWSEVLNGSHCDCERGVHVVDLEG